MAQQQFPSDLPLNSGGKIPVIGLGTATYPFVESKIAKLAMLEALKLGIRHIDTATLYNTEGDLGEVIFEALELGLIKSRGELFITSKLWCNDAHPDLVIPALQKSLKNLKLDYIDLYLIHWPLSVRRGSTNRMPKKQDLRALDIKGVWTSMEECQISGLTKSIGVSNFSTKKLGDLLALANIPPSVNQVMVNPLWQQKKMIEFCKANGVLVVAYSPLGATGSAWGTNLVMENEVLNEIATTKAKFVAQICLRWVYEQGVGVVFKSYNKERLKQNVDIFGWELSDEENKKISELKWPPGYFNIGNNFISEEYGPFKSLEELWDEQL